MKKIIILLLLTIPYITNTLQKSTRELIILYDCGTETLDNLNDGAIIVNLQKALTEKAAPILTTETLMQLLISCKQKAAKFLHQSATSENNFFYQVCHSINLNDFIIKKITDGTNVLYLIIPHTYIAECVKNKQPLGLHIDSFPTVAESDIQYDTAKNKGCSSFLIQQLPAIFVTTLEESPWIWSIVLNGHGSFSQEAELQLEEIRIKKQKINEKLARIERTNQFELYTKKQALKTQLELLDSFSQSLAEVRTIAGMSLPDFKKFLHFLNEKIRTNILVYLSCSSGGKNFIDPYRDNQSGAIMNLHYTVVTAAITEAAVQIQRRIQETLSVTMGPFFTINDTKSKVSVTNDIKSFYQFFISLHNPSMPIEKIIALLINIPYQGSGPITNISLIPSMRMPGSDEITIHITNDYIVALTPEIIPIDTSLILSNKQVLLVPCQKIPCTLEMPSFQFPAIISQCPGTACHYFATIRAKASIDDIIKKFLCLNMTSSKLFYIQKLICSSGTYTDVMIFVNTPLTSEERIRIEQSKTEIQISSRSLPLSNGIFVTQGATTKGQLWNSHNQCAEFPQLLKLEPRTDFAAIKATVLAYFKGAQSHQDTIKIRYIHPNQNIFTKIMQTETAQYITKQFSTIAETLKIVAQRLYSNPIIYLLTHGIYSVFKKLINSTESPLYSDTYYS